jgi:hypothetical protein
MKITRRTLIAGGIAAPTTAATGIWLLADSGNRAPSDVSIITANGKRLVTANGMPNHAIGDFPNSHDPVPLRTQKHTLQTPFTPAATEKPVPLAMWLFGIAVNGVPFEPSGPFWNADGNCGWQFEVLHPANAVALGIDCNRVIRRGEELTTTTVCRPAYCGSLPSPHRVIPCTCSATPPMVFRSMVLNVRATRPT